MRKRLLCGAAIDRFKRLISPVLVVYTTVRLSDHLSAICQTDISLFLFLLCSGAGVEVFILHPAGRVAAVQEMQVRLPTPASLPLLH